jgi:two-component system sensor histidine kinase KdpD
VTGGALGWRRRILGLVVALTGGPLLSWLLFATSNEETITSDVLSYQLLVVVVALIGGIWPALFAAVLSGLTLDFLFIHPRFTVTIDNPLHALALVLYVVIAILVSWIVDQAARRTRRARRAAAESELLATVSGSVLRGERRPGSGQPHPRGVRRERGAPAGRRRIHPAGAGDRRRAGARRPGDRGARRHGCRGGPRATLELHGGDVGAPERRLLDVITAQLAAALEHSELTQTARTADALAATDQVRTALLSAVSHDLRRPLAAAIAAVGGLRAAGPSLSAADHDELVATADESLAALAALVTDLLDVSRVQAGVLAVSLSPSTLREQSSKPSMSSASDPTSSSSRSIRPSLRCAPTPCCCSGSSSMCSPMRAATRRPARACASHPAGSDRPSNCVSSTTAPASAPTGRTTSSRPSSGSATPTTPPGSDSGSPCRRVSPRAWAAP